MKVSAINSSPWPRHHTKRCTYIAGNIQVWACEPSVPSHMVELPLSFTNQLEHVPPSATAKLIKEKPSTTLTCNRCNHIHGSRYHSHLKKFLVFQLHQAGKWDKPIRSTSNTSKDGLTPLKSNIVLTPEDLKVIGVPKANAPSTTQSHISAWDAIAKKGTTGWSFNVSLNYRFIPSVAGSAYLQVAYLMTYILTNCYYAFPKAGRKLRELISQDKTKDLGASIIAPKTVGVGGSPWLAEIIEPDSLRCL